MSARRDWMADWLPASEDELAAIDLWNAYYYETEVHDQGCCSARTEDGTAMPINASERAACDQFARAARQRIEQVAVEMNIPPHVLRRARDRALERPTEKLKALLASARAPRN